MGLRRNLLGDEAPREQFQNVPLILGQKNVRLSDPAVPPDNPQAVALAVAVVDQQGSDASDLAREILWRDGLAVQGNPRSLLFQVFRPLQAGFDNRQELVGREGLGEVGVRARVVSGDPVAEHRSRADQYHGDPGQLLCQQVGVGVRVGFGVRFRVGRLPNVIQELEAVRSRHADVADNAVRDVVVVFVVVFFVLFPHDQ
mmetsp:Transcript_11612/g.33419  ORF Transcript_11612/g.33419 Transcript_11612/m.33419 type:complete len:200 (-) Transcript_11612:526-1125(-)